MKDKFGADVLIVMLLVGIFIIVLVSAAKSNEESTTSDYIEYMTKYKNLDNTYTKLKRKSFLNLVIESFSDPIIKILLIAL